MLHICNKLRAGPILDLCWVQLSHPSWCPEFLKIIFSKND